MEKMQYLISHYSPLVVTTVKSIEKQSDGSEEIVVHIHSACCKQDYIYTRANGKIYLEGIEVGEGMKDSIIIAEKLYRELNNKL